MFDHCDDDYGKEVRERNIKKGGLALMVKKRISQLKNVVHHHMSIYGHFAWGQRLGGWVDGNLQYELTTINEHGLLDNLCQSDRIS